MTDDHAPSDDEDIVVRAALQAIEAHGDELLQAALSGEPPLQVLIPLLEPIIIERAHWGKVDRLIRDWLGLGFEQVGRKWVPTRLPHKGLCYYQADSGEPARPT